jgi:hypothetical protein
MLIDVLLFVLGGVPLKPRSDENASPPLLADVFGAIVVGFELVCGRNIPAFVGMLLVRASKLYDDAAPEVALLEPIIGPLDVFVVDAPPTDDGFDWDQSKSRRSSIVTQACGE